MGLGAKIRASTLDIAVELAGDCEFQEFLQ